MNGIIINLIEWMVTNSVHIFKTVWGPLLKTGKINVLIAQTERAKLAIIYAGICVGNAVMAVGRVDRLFNAGQVACQLKTDVHPARS